MLSFEPSVIVIDDNLTDDLGLSVGHRGSGLDLPRVVTGDRVEGISAAWITYDDMNLYVALIAYDDPEQVRVNVTDRDNIFGDDYFGMLAPGVDEPAEDPHHATETDQ